MTGKPECLHCAILAAISKWAMANGTQNDQQVTHASGTMIFGSMVEVVMDIMSMTPPAERRELYGFLFQRIMNAGLGSGMIEQGGAPTKKQTIN